MHGAQVIETQGLTKMYGNHVGVADLTLTVDAGEVFGFLGPNGAGKTTTIRMLTGLLSATRGQAQVLGLDPWRDGVTARSRIGYLPGDLALYPNLTGRQTLEFLGRMRGHVPHARIVALADRFAVDLDRRTRELSRGNRQKLGLLQAFMHDPALLILDEPTSGLDPLMQNEFALLVREAVDGGATVFLSSHVLGEVESLADRVAIINEGQLAVVAPIEELRTHAVRHLDLQFPAVAPLGRFADIPGVVAASAEGVTVRVHVAGPVTEVLRVAVEHGVEQVVTHEPDLEDVFWQYTKGGVHDAPGAGVEVPA